MNEEKGIRQLARQIKVSHTAIANAMKDLNITGQSQGQGKPTLLNANEQARIAAYLGCSAALNNSSAITPSSALSVIPDDVDLPLDGYTYEGAENLTLIDTSQRRSSAMQGFMNHLDNYQGSGKNLADAMVEDAKRRGADLGTQIALAELGTAISTSQAIKNDAAKKLGLVKDSEPAS